MKQAIALVLCALIVFAVVSCASANTHSGIIKMKMSDEAVEMQKSYRDKNLTAYFDEDHFDEYKKIFYLSNQSEVLPEYEFKNTLGCETKWGNAVYTLSNGDDYENIVIYIHGGAWTYGIATDHLCFVDKLVDALDAKVYLPLYELAPYSTFEAAYEYLFNIYDDLLKEGKKIFLMGDSAGGNIASSLSLQLKEAGKKLPDKQVLLSPAVDLTFSNPDMEEKKDEDVMLAAYGCRECAKLWAGGTDLSDSRLSPLNGDLEGLEDTLLFIATDGILYPDAMLFREKMLESGNNIQTVIGEGYWHVFPASFNQIPEEQASIEVIKDFCLK